jgi:hypothetical protein
MLLTMCRAADSGLQTLLARTRLTRAVHLLTPSSRLAALLPMCRGTSN